MSRAVRIAALIYTSSMLLARVIGLVREAVIGRILGDQPEADVYWVAFILPDFLNYLLAGGALALVFIPLLQASNERGGAEARWATFWRISAPVSALTVILTALLWMLTPQLVVHLSPGFDSDQLQLLSRLTRIILPAQIFHVCGALISSTLQAEDRHLAPAIAPLIYTGGIICGGLLLGPTLGAEGFAWGVLIGSMLGPFGCPLVGALRYGLKWKPRWELSHPEVKRYLWRALPVMLGFSVVMLDELVVKRMATALESGVVSQLHYARTLMRVPMGVFGLAMGLAAFPTLSRLVARGEERAAIQLLRRSTEALLVLVGISQVALTLSGREFAQVIWGSRQLSQGGVEGIGVYCAALCVGLWAWSAQGLIARGFYARGQTWLPTLIGSLVLCVCLPLYGYGARSDLLWLRSLSEVFQLGERPGLGLALASSASISLYVLALWTTLAWVSGEGIREVLRFLKTLAQIALVVAGSLYLTQSLWPRPPIDEPRALWELITLGGGRALLGAGLFILIASLLRVESLSLITERLRSKLVRVKRS